MSESKPKPVRPKLQRSERVFSESHLTSWELFVRDSLLTLAWPELLNSVSGSTASDLISRRGVFSRRYYGSVEQLQQPEVDGHEHCRRFRIENGDSPGEKDEMFGSPSTPVLENPEYQTRWYFKYFLGKLHQNYIGVDNDKSPFFLSIVMNEDNNSLVPLYRAILFRKCGAHKISLPIPQNKVLTVKQILSNFPNMDKVEKGPKEIFTPDIQKDLLLLEEQEGSVNFKFGVIYMKQGQNSDDEMLSNEHGSNKFEQFLTLLGDRVRLKGWDKYRGGLDTKGDMTGKYSVYTVYEGHEIMFHVSTLLPYSRDNRQQVERKRHIGNDIVNIVFIDMEEDDQNETAHAQFNPTCIKSQFTHIFAAVSVSSNGHYRLSVFSDEAVPLFGPGLPCPPMFSDPYAFREFLLVKLINGEKATFETPTFARKRQRTLEMLIKDLHSEHVTDARITMLNRRAFSDVLAETPRHSRLKEDSRQIEFVRIGQALKLEAIVRGDAPTSLASTGAAGTVFKRSPWEANCFYPVFPSHPIACGDSWGENRLVVATEDGTFVVEDGTSHRQIFDKSLQVRQLNVVEPHGIILLRAGSAHKDCKIYVFRLSQIEMTTEIFTRIDVKEHRMERTRGAHLYSISRAGGARLRMCVAIGRKLLMFQWKHSAAWTAWCPASDTDTVEGFSFFWELNLSEQPSILTILDNVWSPISPTHGDILVCVGYKNHWDVVNGRSGQAQHLYTVEGTRTHLVAALDLYEDQEIQLMLCYNHTCHFQKLNETINCEAMNFDFHWNSAPTDIVCAFPYIIAFTSNTMEIRLVVNGNLIHTMSMPKLQLITSKNDIFFATTAPEFFPNKTDRLYVDIRQQGLQKVSPPSSPNASPEVKPLRIYRIPIHALSRAPHPDHSRTCSPPVWKSADSKLAVPDQPRVSRSASSSPVPPVRARLQPAAIK
ncbi:GTPase-activating Rap/Ran-GAP domain-like protein 3 isoform X2 [Dendroctonus ponderosae]|uniref:Rap-GAP domain-containing protein n=1 Tax=Dendroctonus ponderosae TaxID=77166 RepID=A0AAR5PKZ5_DENPD|nr:GTPase-activating Rap/Ran-GAP domain-like protein 3 isoform X2 [Dendroctonus ponderosae]XP_048526110.1 GTPase-activating Rap/Ran-GAP domain-like protein 3 isoform X2 [Dendroctonus ponderosae]